MYREDADSLLLIKVVIDSPLAAGERTKHRDLLNSQDLK